MQKKKTSGPPDGRKYRLVVLSLLTLLAAFGLASLNPVMASLFPELITGILGLNLLYAGGNVGNKWVLGKNGALTVAPPTPEPPQEEQGE